MVASAPVLRRALKAKSPSLALERRLWAQGHDVVVGVDEVGRGAWAGPLTVGAAVLPRDRRVYKVRDSKLLTEAEREALFERIGSWCRAWAVGHASQVECDALGMANAQRLAASRAIDGLDLIPDHVVVDGNWDFVGRGCTQRVVGADATCLSVAAASILAKVSRDRIMRGLAPHFPGYDFDLNKGYPCPRHKLALAADGPTSIHRRTWVFMDHLPWTALHRPLDRPLDRPLVERASLPEVGYLRAMTDPKPPTDERLDKVQDDIDQARRSAEDADVLIDPDEPRYYESDDDDDTDDGDAGTDDDDDDTDDADTADADTAATTDESDDDDTDDGDAGTDDDDDDTDDTDDTDDADTDDADTAATTADDDDHDDDDDDDHDDESIGPPG